ncbi:WXG100 family type VII secretion target [Herpetosiphon sp. NSE202]|uniref:WXG100 family type VII secretion target n=1 Tax=Herpetosiphon sp. NSE202 TaxID=3351349 RepID=UPI00364029C7
MTAPVIQIDYEQVNQVVERWQTQYDRVDSLKQTLQITYKQLQADWQGQAAQAFFKEMDRTVLPVLERLKKTIAEAKSTTLQIS